jgi:class 3 adenylate cyclase
MRDDADVATAPQTDYAIGRGGHHLAYQVTGDGKQDVLFVAEERTPIDLLWDDPLAAAALRRLAGVGRLILCDLRGWGSSDAVPSSELPAMQAWSDDILSVLDAAESECAAIVASSEPCLPVMLFAATHPGRVDRLALINPYARYLRGPDTPFGLPESTAERYVQRYRETNGRGTLTDFIAPSRAAEPMFRRWITRCERLGGGPGEAAAVYRMFMHTDLLGVVPSIRVPTLLVRRRGDRHVRDGHARLLADRLPDARLVELDGDDNFWASGDVDALLDQIAPFLTGGGRAGGITNRVLSTVMFTDIVGSTERAAALGDAAWTSLLEAHDDLVTTHVAAFGGRLVKSTGDGALATFDGPARAIQCAFGLTRAVDGLGLELRAGLHTGEIELRGADVGGMAVHIGARVAALADPGEVLVSGAVPPLVSGSGIRFHDRGARQLKGVPDPWPIFMVAAL